LFFFFFFLVFSSSFFSFNIQTCSKDTMQTERKWKNKGRRRRRRKKEGPQGQISLDKKQQQRNNQGDHTGGSSVQGVTNCEGNEESILF